MPLHGSQVKANKRKDCIIWARFSLEKLQKKCVIDATKETLLLLLLARRLAISEITWYSCFPERAFAMIAVSGEEVLLVLSRANTPLAIKYAKYLRWEKDTGDLLAMKILHVLVAKGVKESPQIGRLGSHLRLLPFVWQT